ncbi:MAG: RpiB/LacA/LacB family sugar-phosphate isomerase [Bacteroidota bacterium]|nr:RpiB/LacA/LacB family sugar-phosphate isomerase [Bacteroidota bacterium]
MKSVKLGLASDHAGYSLKNWLIEKLIETGYEVKDFGCNSDDSCDYPDYAHPLAEAIENGEVDKGFSLCGSGNGINMVVNKHARVRSALCWNNEITVLARSHNDANICAIPARFVEKEQAWKMIKVFLETEFDGGRHLRRINKIPIS